MTEDIRTAAPRREDAVAAWNRAEASEDAVAAPPASDAAADRWFLLSLAAVVAIEIGILWALLM